MELAFSECCVRQKDILNKLCVLNIFSTKSGLLKGLNYYVQFFQKLKKGKILVLMEVISNIAGIFKIRIDYKLWLLWRRTKSVINPWLPPGSSKVWEGGTHWAKKSLRKSIVNISPSSSALSLAFPKSSQIRKNI